MTIHKNIIFKYPWRAYQQRVLDHIDQHLADGKLHIIAPPGSGKTVLGLQAMLHLGKPCLILAPSIAIRNQWKERLLNDFKYEGLEEHISLDLKNPKTITISTYQAVHAAVKAEFALVETLKKEGIETLVVDECHHLQKAWWVSLMEMVKGIEPTVISLTATPPYDVSGAEWERYKHLCGEIDEEIDVPELVAEHNLCPHQDYIFFSYPTEDEAGELQSFHEKVQEFWELVNLNLTFKRYLKRHPHLYNPDGNLEAIYSDPAYFSSMIVVLHHLGRVVPAQAIGIIGADETQIPVLDINWMTTFWNGVLKDPYFQGLEGEPEYDSVIKQLKRTGAVEQGRVSFTQTRKVDQKIRSSRSKLESVETIVQTEYNALKEDLRMVILTDYIRKEYLPKHEVDLPEMDKMGVIPIFERLRAKFPIELELGILTGTIVILPKYSEALFDKIVAEAKVDAKEIKKIPLVHDTDYYRVETSGKAKDLIVHLVTDLFQRGGITCLIGTKSLLGEGWDAPAINSLVLATVVGSYVYSNQMRGRAIRTLAHDPEKTANIWHLACIDPYAEGGGTDLKSIRRRFRAFHGLSFHSDPIIQNGIARFQLEKSIKNIDTINANMQLHAENRNRLRQEWLSALEKGKHITEEIKIPVKKARAYHKRRDFLWKEAKKALLLEEETWQKGISNSIFISIIFCLFISLAGKEAFIATLTLTGLVTLLLAVPCFIYNIPILSKIKTIRLKQQLNRKFTQKTITLVLIGIVFCFVFYFIFAAPALFTFLLWIFMLFSFHITAKENKIIPIWEDYLQYEQPKAFFNKIVVGLTSALYRLNHISVAPPKIDYAIELNEQNEWSLELKNLPSKEEHLVLDCLEELMNPVDNPRFLLAVNQEPLEGYEVEGEKAKIYYPIPSAIGKRKKDAEIFKQYWEERFGDSELIFTRNTDGRYELLKARGQSFDRLEDGEIERLSKWQ